MILPAICIIYSKDPELVRQTKAYLRTMAEVRRAIKFDWE